MTTLTHKASRLAVIILIAWAAVQQVLGAWCGGKEWLLLAASMMLEGSVAYVDIMETNPPLILWIYQVPVYLARFVDAEPAAILAMFTLLLAATSVALCATLLARHEGLAPRTREKLLWLIAFIAVVLPERSFFSDREHLFLLLTMPYFLRYMPGIIVHPVSPRLRIIIALMAMLGFFFKPHMLVFAVMIALLRLWRDPNWRTLFVMEHWLIGGGWVVYLFLIGRLTPEYFTVVWPLLRETYSAYTNGIMGFYHFLPAPCGLLLAFAGYRGKLDTPLRKDLHYLLWLCMAGFVYALISNGWHYTFYPLNAFVLLTIGWLLAEYGWIGSNSDDEALIAQSGTGITCSKIFMSLYVTGKLLPLLCFNMVIAPVTTFDRLLSSFEETIREEHATSFGAVSIHFGYWPRLAHTTHTAFASRYHMLWPLYKFVRDGNSSTTNNWVAAHVAQDMADDLARKKPDIVFVDNSPNFSNTGHAFDAIAYLQNFPAFAAAWKDYSRLKTVDLCQPPETAQPKPETDGCRYDIFKRN